MTLNINLEDVPDAILEAVKARIMANRRRLLDREELLRQPPLQPKPQSRKFGADSKRWKRPQPAAVANYAPDKLVIWYPDEAPPKATIKGVTITDLWPDFAASRPSVYPPGFPSSYVVDTFQGVNTLGAPDTDYYQGPYWEFSNLSNALDIGSKPFTLEFWWRLGTSLPGSDWTKSAFVQLEFESAVGGVFVILRSDGGSPTLSSPPTIGMYAGPGSEYAMNTEDVISSADASSFNHLAIQRHNATNYTVHYKGAVLQSWTMASFSYSSVPIIILPTAINVPGTAISQIRLSNSALYGTGTFTPPTKAFYKPAA
jgi:hypothetical protein